MPTPPASGLFADAVRHHQAGQAEQAGALYRRVLALAPRHADALHLSGLLAFDAGQHDRARELIGRAIRVDPGKAPFHLNLGHALAALRAAGRGDPRLPERHTAAGGLPRRPSRPRQRPAGRGQAGAGRRRVRGCAAHRARLRRRARQPRRGAEAAGALRRGACRPARRDPPAAGRGGSALQPGERPGRVGTVRRGGRRLRHRPAAPAGLRRGTLQPRQRPGRRGTGGRRGGRLPRRDREQAGLRRRPCQPRQRARHHRAARRGDRGAGGRHPARARHLPGRTPTWETCSRTPAGSKRPCAPTTPRSASTRASPTPGPTC